MGSNAYNFPDFVNNPDPTTLLTAYNSPSGITSTSTISNDVLNSFNALITAQTNNAICDASCIYDICLNELYVAMEEAKINEIEAPYEYEQAEIAYYAFLGESVPNNFQELKYKAKYDELKLEYITLFEEAFYKAIQLNENYNTMYINTKNSYDLYLDLLNRNEKLREQLNMTASTIFTNDRKTIYENQGLKTIQMHGKILFIFHILFVLFFIFAVFYFKSTLTIYSKIFLIILIILQPMISRLIMFLLSKIYNSVKTILPKNVYLTL